MGSNPSYDPAVLSRPITQKRLAAALRAERRLAAVQPRDRRPVSDRLDVQADHRVRRAAKRASSRRHAVNDPGCIEIGAAKQPFCNAGKAVNGTLELLEALQVSSDVYFYTSAATLNALQGQPLQKRRTASGWASRRASTCRARSPGVVPDRRWRDEIDQLERRAASAAATHVCGSYSDMRAVDASATT